MYIYEESISAQFYNLHFSCFCSFDTIFYSNHDFFENAATLMQQILTLWRGCVIQSTQISWWGEVNKRSSCRGLRITSCIWHENWNAASERVKIPRSLCHVHFRKCVANCANRGFFSVEFFNDFPASNFVRVKLFFTIYVTHCKDWKLGIPRKMMDRCFHQNHFYHA